MRFRGFLLPAVIAVIAASCGGDSDPTTAALGSDATTTTTTSPPGTTTTTEAPLEAGPALVTFDGTTCTITGGPVEPGLSEILVLNTSSAGTEAYLFKLNSTYTVDTLAGDVVAGRFDRFGLAGNDDPTGFEESTAVRMPQNAADPISQPFTASTGAWGVVCLDVLNLEAYLGSDVIEVS